MSLISRYFKAMTNNRNKLINKKYDISLRKFTLQASSYKLLSKNNNKKGRTINKIQRNYHDDGAFGYRVPREFRMPDCK